MNTISTILMTVRSRVTEAIGTCGVIYALSFVLFLYTLVCRIYHGRLPCICSNTNTSSSMPCPPPARSNALYP